MIEGRVISRATIHALWLLLVTCAGLTMSAEPHEYRLKWQSPTPADGHSHVWEQACFSHDGQRIIALEKSVGEHAVVKDFGLREFSASGQLLRETSLFKDYLGKTTSWPRPGAIDALLPLDDDGLLVIGNIEHEGITSVVKLDSERQIVLFKRLSEKLFYAEFHKFLVLPEGVLLVGAAGTEAIVALIGFDGELLWSRAYHRAERLNRFIDVCLSQDRESLYFVGQSGITNKFGLGPSDVWLVQAKPTGEVLHETFFPGRSPSIAGEFSDRRLAIVYDVKSDLGSANRLRIVGPDGKMLLEEPIAIGSSLLAYRPGLARLRDDRFLISGNGRVHEFDLTGQQVGVLGKDLIVPHHLSQLVIHGDTVLVLGTMLRDQQVPRGNLYYLSPE